MNRIVKKFYELKKKRKKALIVYLTAGDPSLKKNQELIHAFEKDGVDLIELGVPFSDPLADGPVIQAASQRALSKGTRLTDILGLVKKARRSSDLPILLMSYLNPLLRFGMQRFARQAAASGVDGVIIPDLPPDEGRAIASALRKQGLCLVYLLAPTSTPERVQKIIKASSGFIYYVSLTGVTGSKQQAPGLMRDNLRRARLKSRLPVCVGFGISTPRHAKAMAKLSDGVIVGSALVNALYENPWMSATAFSNKFVRPFARALNGKG